MSCEIRNWKVSYYQNKRQTWVYGLLTCSPFNIKFHKESVTSKPQSTEGNQGDHRQTQTKDDTENESDDVLLLYTDIKCVQRAKSMWIFQAVTVETHDGTVHWFSSLPDRHSVYNALDYFSRHNLLDTSNAKKPTCDPANHTRIGQQLLRSAEDSERTLAAAAADLHGQGRQLDRASVRLMELHEHLDVAERLLTGLETYLGQWSLPPQYKQMDMVQISKDDVSSDQDLEVLSSELSKDVWRSQKLSFLRVTESGLTLMSSHQKLLHSLRWIDLSRVFVVSPWEVVLTKHVAGRADISVSVVSSALLPVLKVLEKKVPHLMDFQSPPPHLTSTTVPDKGTTRTKIMSGQAHSIQGGNNQLGAGKNTSTPADSENPYLQFQQGRQKQEQVSEQELSALHSKLGGLKMMAQAVGGELTAQNEALDDMINSVDLADSRVQDATQRTKRLM